MVVDVTVTRGFTEINVNVAPSRLRPCTWKFGITDPARATAGMTEVITGAGKHDKLAV